MMLSDPKSKLITMYPDLSDDVLGPVFVTERQCARFVARVQRGVVINMAVEKKYIESKLTNATEILKWYQ